MQSVESICCHWKLKEFKDLKVALQALPILMLQFTVFCYVMFHVISHVMYSQCLLPVVEMHSPLAHYSHSGLTSHGSAVSRDDFNMTRINFLCWIHLHAGFLCPVKHFMCLIIFTYMELCRMPLFGRWGCICLLFFWMPTVSMCRCNNQDWHRHRDHNPHWLEA